MSSLEGQTFAGYEIVAKLGEGGMGAVYKAKQPVLNRFVALKTMAAHLGGDKEFVARFQREAASAATLNHPNVVAVHTAGESDGTHYIVMEFVDGESVRKRLDRDGKISPAEALAIAIYVAQALQYAWNEARLIHRDIKPDNIFISKKGEVKVGDLGLAKSLTAEGTEMTATGMAMGSPHYISPEQATGIRDIDFRTDIYSLGCTLYHMLTGQTPYKGDSSMIVMMKHVNDPPPAIFKAWPQCPMPLGMLVGRMLAKDRNARSKSYEQLVADLFAVSEKLQQAAAASAPAPVPVVTSKPVVVEKTAAATQAPAPSPDAPTVALRPSAKPKSLTAIYAAVGAAVVAALAGLLLWSPWKAVMFSDDALVREVATLPAERQVARVVAKLKKLNPGYDGQETHKIEKGVVTELLFSAVKVADISPVRALRGLKKLTATGTEAETSPLADLWPLAGLPLTELNCGFSLVSDLSPLKGMQLTKLTCWRTQVGDLSALRGMPLTFLNCSSISIDDLSPLKGMPLTILRCWNTKICDLKPLVGMPLEQLWVFDTKASNLSPVADLPITVLHCSESQVRDLSPIIKMPLRSFSYDFKTVRDTEILRSVKTLKTINHVPVETFWEQVNKGTVPQPKWWERKQKAGLLSEGASEDDFLKEVATLSAEQQVARVVAELKKLNPGFDSKEKHKIEGSDVTDLEISALNVTDISPVRALTKLRRFVCLASTDGKKRSKLSDLTPLQGLSLKELRVPGCDVSDLSPVRGMPLGHVGINYTLVIGLSPLKGAPVDTLNCQGVPIRDLSPLRGAPLRSLMCDGTQVSDLSPLRDSPLEILSCDATVATSPTNREILRAIPTLKTIKSSRAAR